MGVFSVWQWLIIGTVVLILFGGRGKVSGILGDLGKGLKAFKTNISDDSDTLDDKYKNNNPQVLKRYDNNTLTKNDSLGDTKESLDRK